MKWFLLAVGVFVCAATPWPAMLGVADAVGHSVEAVVNGIEHLAGRKTVHVDGARDRPGSPRNGAFAADLSGRARVIDGDTIDIGGLGCGCMGWMRRKAHRIVLPAASAGRAGAGRRERLPSGLTAGRWHVKSVIWIATDGSLLCAGRTAGM